MFLNNIHKPTVALVVTLMLMVAACESASDRQHSNQEVPESEPGVRVAWQEPIEIATGSAHVGPWRMNESEFRYVDDPTLAVSDSGAIVVAWADNERQDVMLVRLEPDEEHPGEPVNVSSSPDVFSWLPRLAFGASDDQVYALWQEILFTGGSHGGEILFARSKDGGRTFSEPLNLSNTDDGAGKGRLTVERWHNGSLDLLHGHDGMLYAAWTAYEGPLHVSRSEDGGRSFSEPLHIAGDHSVPARAPSLALDDEGRLLVAWTVGEDPDADIHITRQVTDDWSFETPAKIHTGAGHADAPKIDVDEHGHVHLVYSLAAEGPTDFPQVVHSQAEPGSLEFSPARRIVPQDSAIGRGSGFPHLGIRDQTLVVAWENFPPAGNFALGLGFAFSQDGGESFSRAGLIPASNRRDDGVSGGRQGLLMDKLDIGTDGLIAAVHSTFNEGKSSSIWLFLGRVNESPD